LSRTEIFKEIEKQEPTLWQQKQSTRAVFFIGGFGAASWAPLVPFLKMRLAIGEDSLGLLLLCIIGFGSLLTMPFSGVAAAKFGCRKVIAVARESVIFHFWGGRKSCLSIWQFRQSARLAI